MSQTAKQIIDIYEREDAALVHENWSAATRLVVAKNCIRALTELLATREQATTELLAIKKRADEWADAHHRGVMPGSHESDQLIGEAEGIACDLANWETNAGEAAESGRTGATPVNPVGGAPEAPAPGPHPSPAPHRSRADLSANGGTAIEWKALCDAEARENARVQARACARVTANWLDAADDSKTTLLRAMLRAFASNDGSLQRANDGAPTITHADLDLDSASSAPLC